MYSCDSVVFDFFVFFFKQKTAYEMRISDWSSDVCSSDLMRVASYLVDGRPAWGLVTADGEGLVDATSVHPTLKAALAAGGLGDLKRRLAGRPADRRVADTRKIGRASCRERVCQYV